MDSDRNEWVHYELGDITLITAGGDRPSKYTNKKTIECYVPIYSNGIEMKDYMVIQMLQKFMRKV